MNTQQFLGHTVLAAGMLCLAAARADVITLQPMTARSGGTDNYHDDFLGSANSGSGAQFGVIGEQGPTIVEEYLVQFDQLSSWIGGSDKVTNATLTLLFNAVTYDDPTNPPPQIQVFRLTNSWVGNTNSGATATWTSRGGALGNWATAGGDYDPTPVASLAFPSAPPNNTLVSWDVTGLVSNWVDGTYPNYGMLLKWDRTDVNRWYGFAGPDGPYYGAYWYGNPNLFPAPSLTFATIPEPSGTVLLFLGCAGCLLVGRTRRDRRSRS